MSKILLLDGFFLLHRADVKFGSPQEGKPSYHIVYNFFRSLRALIEQFSPEKVYFCLEGTRVFRKELYADYKANRIIKKASKNQTQQEDFNRQKDLVLHLLKYLPIHLIWAERYEADDVIGTLADQLKDEEVVIVSKDSDFLQLLQKGYPSLRIYDPIAKTFQEIPSLHYLAFKALKGDTSDNIPGLVSEEEAAKLVENTVALKQFLAVPENAANFSFNRKLIEIQIIPDQELIMRDDWQIDYSYLQSEFSKMEFSSMLTDKYWNKFQETFNSLI